MLNYIIRRLLVMIPLLIGMSFVVFMLMHLAPGDVMAQYKFDPRISRETIRKIERVLERYSSIVVFADLNLKLNVLWVIVRPGPGRCWKNPNRNSR